MGIPEGFSSGRVIPAAERYAREYGSKKAVILIVDSLGYSLYRHLAPIMKYTREIEEEGLLLKCRSVANKTAPALASIFTGTLPAEHGILSNEDAPQKQAEGPSDPRVRSVLERAHECEMHSSVVIESKGAGTFRGKVGDVYGVPNSEDILDYDNKITKCAVDALSKGPDLLAVHLRSIDRFSHRAHRWRDLRRAARAVDRNTRTIFENAPEGTAFFICGDHAIHGGRKWLLNASPEELENYRNNLVALIVACS